MARRDSEKRILQALHDSYREALEKSKRDPSVGARPQGLRFKELKDRTRLHQDTLTERLRSLRKEGDVVLSETGFYNIGSPGERHLVLSSLLLLIEELGPGYVSTGGPSSDSIRDEERAVLRSTTLFALPDRPWPWLGDLLRAFHAEVAAREILLACAEAKVPIEEVSEGRRCAEIVAVFKRRRLEGKQILISVVDWDVLKAELTEAYVKRIAEQAQALRSRVAT